MNNISKLIRLIGCKKALEEEHKSIMQKIHDLEAEIGVGSFKINDDRDLLIIRHINGVKVSWKKLATDWIAPGKLQELVKDYGTRHDYYTATIKETK